MGIKSADKTKFDFNNRNVNLTYFIAMSVGHRNYVYDHQKQLQDQIFKPLIKITVSLSLVSETVTKIILF